MSFGKDARTCMAKSTSERQDVLGQQGLLAACGKDDANGRAVHVLHDRCSFSECYPFSERQSCSVCKTSLCMLWVYVVGVVYCIGV